MEIRCSDAFAELLRLDAAPPSQVTAVSVGPAQGTPIGLDPGLYHWRATGGVSCRVVTGDCTVLLVSGGEDPWPTPPTNELAALASYDSAVRAYFAGP
jgi:hypothetical protein